jgi:hypothetical protein
MKILSAQEGPSLFAEKSVPRDSFQLEAMGLNHVCSFRIPTDSGRKAALARQISTTVRPGEKNVVVWIAQTGVWPSSENQQLFYALRRSWGEPRSLAEAPYHLFSALDREQLECLLDIVLFFFWDVLVLSPSQAVGLWFSHDEILDLHAGDKAEGALFRGVFEDLNLDAVG